MSTKPTYQFRRVTAGVETLPRGFSMPRHHHNEGYAIVVLSGCFTEVGFAGRMYAEPGHVLLHGRFDCHLANATLKQRPEILRLPWRHDTIEGRFSLKDPDSLVRLAETDPEAAAAALYDDLRTVAPRDEYWVDDLACALRNNSISRLQEWAETRGLRPDTVSYVFGREFGVCPKRFRLECRTRLAWRAIMCSSSSFTDIAFNLGFADLAHLTRSIRLLTGRSPSDWRLRQQAQFGRAPTGRHRKAPRGRVRPA